MKPVPILRTSTCGGCSAVIACTLALLSTSACAGDLDPRHRPQGGQDLSDAALAETSTEVQAVDAVPRLREVVVGEDPSEDIIVVPDCAICQPTEDGGVACHRAPCEDALDGGAQL